LSDANGTGTENAGEAAAAATTAPLMTKIKSRAQVLLCKGCCSGRTDRGLPEVPVERIKAVWKAEKLNRVVQLTISGCLGPCELPNVAVVLDARGATWYGRLEGDAPYDALIAWARDCAAAGSPLPPPGALEGYRFQRFQDEPSSP
jgi:cobaltochelatase CobN